MVLLKSILVVVFILFFIPLSMASVMVPNPIGEPGFETVTGWASSESDPGGCLSGFRTSNWKSVGTYSFEFRVSSDCNYQAGNYFQITRNVDFTGIVKITWDEWTNYWMLSKGTYVNGTLITAGQNLRSLGLTGTTVLTIKYYTDGAGLMGGIVYPQGAYRIDNLVAYNNTLPTTPVSVQHLNYFNSSSTTITWAASTDNESDTLTYDVKVGTTSGGTDVLDYSGDTDTTSNSFTMDPENSYFYSVRACDPSGCSGWSTEKSFGFAIITPYTPANGSALTKSYPPLTSDILFTWSEIGGGLSYNLKIAKDINFNILVVDTTTSNNYSANALEASSYWWKVQYYNASSGYFYNESSVFNFTLTNIPPGGSGSRIYGTVYHINGNTKIPVSGSEVRIWNNLSTISDSMITGSNGYYEFTGLSNSTTYFIQAKKSDEYDDSAVEIVTTGIGLGIEKDLILFDCTIAYNCFANKVDLKFTVKNFWGTRYYSGVIASAFKENEIIASEIKTTDTMGVVSFKLIENNMYRFTFINSSLGISKEFTINAFAGSYDVIVDDPVDEFFPGGHNALADVIVTTSTNVINATHAQIIATYNDTMGETSNLVFYLNSTNPTDPLNQTPVSIISGGTSGNYTATFEITPYSGTSYIVHVMSDHATHDKIDKTYGVSFEGVPTSFPLSTQILQWFAVGILIFIATIFSANNSSQGGLIVCGIGWIFFGMGYLGGLSYNMAGGLTLATIISLFNLYNERQKSENIS